MDQTEEEFSFQLVKRDGRHEEYDRSKLARSLVRAGAAPGTLAWTLDRIVPGPDLDTDSLRARVAAELEILQPSAARRYATTRSLIARASELSGYGWVGMNPETVSRLGLRPGDTIWLSHGGTPAPFSIESHEGVERGHAWLAPLEMAAMGVREGMKLAASSTYHETSAPAEEPPVHSHAGATAGLLNRQV